MWPGVDCCVVKGASNWNLEKFSYVHFDVCTEENIQVGAAL